jgi:hypothetical protein
MPRRSFLQSAAAEAARPWLDRAKWSPRNRQLIGTLIARNGTGSASYVAEKRPYVVFDWDNTSIMISTASLEYVVAVFATDLKYGYNILRDFADTQLGMVVNRLKKGKVGELSRLAAQALHTDHPRFILQGRQESTGNWLPLETSIKYGKAAPAMLA